MRLASLLLAAAAAAAADPAVAVPEIHGFVSFGAVSTPGVDWIGDTHGVSTDFYEAAINAVSRPREDLRLGAQVFTRNFLGNDAGKVTVDWASADWTPDQRLGIAAGRVKIPLGLYNESLDVDAARTPVFLSKSIYPLDARDLFLSLDGARLHGLLPLHAAGSLEYSLVGGRSHLATDGGFAAFLRKNGLGDPIRDLQVKASLVAMAHWNTPVDGLAFRLTGAQLRGLHVNGELPGASLDTDVALYDYLIASLLWERGRWTFAAEAQRTHGEYSFTTLVGGVPVATSGRADNNAGGYLSANWSATRRLDLYAAVEHLLDDAIAPTATTTSWIAAVRYDLSGHWLVKAEFQEVRGQGGGLSAMDNPDGLPTAWRIFAVKTTVDF